ncbi:MAG: tetratricopeptide repeat protein [Terriglobia bacterium]
MKEPRFNAHSILSPLMVLLLEFTSTAVAPRAQTSLQFNVPYQCPNGLTYIIYRCENRPKGQVCFYKAGQNGQWDSDAYTSGPQMVDRVKGCSVSAPATPPSATLQATNPPYMKEFPSLERVRAELKSADAMETAAKQMGAFWQLQEMINNLAGPRRYRNQLTPDEKRFLGQYAAGYQAAGQPYANYPDRPTWYKLHAHYEVDAVFLEELLNRFFSPGLRAQYLQLKGEQHARAVARSQAAANTRAQMQTGGTGSASPPAPGSGQQDAAQALQQLTQGLSQIIMSVAGNLPAAQPGGSAYANAASVEEANQQWQRALSKSDTFESSDQFVLMFFRPGYAGMMCHGGLLVGEKAYTVEVQNGRIILTFPFDATTKWVLCLRNDGALVSQNAQRLQLFGKQEDKYKPCLVDVLTPKPRAGTSATAAAGTKPATGNSVDPYYAQGKQYYEAKDYANAVAAFKKSIAQNPSSAAYIYVGRAYHDQKQYLEAIEAHKKAIDMAPNSAEAHLWLGMAYHMLQAKMWSEPSPSASQIRKVQENAEAELREAIRLKPDYHDAHFTLGFSLISQNKYSEGLKPFQDAIRLNPEDGLSLYGLGFCYSRLGKKGEAKQIYGQLARLDKDRAQQLLTEINKPVAPSQAASAAPSTMQPQPAAPAANTAEAHYAQGQKYYEAKDYPSALEAYKKAVALKPSWAQAQYGLGMTYIGLEKRKEAMEVAEKLEKLDAKLYEDLVAESVIIDPVFLKVMGDKKMGEKKPEDAVAYYREAIRLGPDYAEAREGLGSAYFALEKYPDAEAALKDAIRLKPDFAEAQFGLGMTFLAMGRRPEAQRVCLTLQRLDKDRAQKLQAAIGRMGATGPRTRAVSPPARPPSNPTQ